MTENREPQLNNADVLPAETESENHEQKTEYNFEFMTEIEPAMISLVKQLKDRIESGEYDRLLSDDAGGRIPTLILRKIFQEKGPDKDIQTNFLLAGRKFKFLDDNEGSKTHDYLKNIIRDPSKTVLVVTEYVATGPTMGKIIRALERAGVKNLDIATMWTSRDQKGFIDKRIKDINEWDFDFGHRPVEYFCGELVGDDRPVEELLVEIKKISGIKKGFDSESSSPIPEKSPENPEIIVKAREDVALMAKRIIDQVWK